MDQAQQQPNPIAVADNPSAGHRPRRSGGAVVLTLAAVALLAVYMKSQMDGLISPWVAQAQVDEKGQLRPLAEVTELIAAEKLVTVEVRSTVRAIKESDIWRGVARAEVVTPVRYLYGVDLSLLEGGAVSLDPAARRYEVLIPKPGRIATEVDTSNPLHEDVTVTGTRLRTRAGEFMLGLARRNLSAEAGRQTLAPDMLECVERETLKRVRGLVKRIVGGANVRVAYR